MKIEPKTKQEFETMFIQANPNINAAAWNMGLSSVVRDRLDESYAVYVKVCETGDWYNDYSPILFLDGASDAEIEETVRAEEIVSMGQRVCMDLQKVAFAKITREDAVKIANMMLDGIIHSINIGGEEIKSPRMFVDRWNNRTEGQDPITGGPQLRI